MEDKQIVEWDERYALGIPLIDSQHKKLIEITNKLYMGCLKGDEAAKLYFMKAVREAVDYVKYHFAAEEKLFERIGYPAAADHKKQHEEFIKEILREIGTFKEGRKFVPNMFVRYLRDWILTHIAVSDKLYADYIKNRGAYTNMNVSVRQKSLTATG
jgi:hemerythrin